MTFTGEYLRKRWELQGKTDLTGEIFEVINAEHLTLHAEYSALVRDSDSVKPEILRCVFGNQHGDVYPKRLSDLR